MSVDAWWLMCCVGFALVLLPGSAEATETAAPNATVNGTVYPNATFSETIGEGPRACPHPFCAVPGWCSGCSQTQGIYVAVFIGILGAGVLAGTIFAMWGAWRGRQLLAGQTYRHVEEETQLGKMVTLELAELSKKRSNEDYF